MVLCGGSEVFQQASMLGLAVPTPGSDEFSPTLPKTCATVAPLTASVANSPTDGALPFAANEGISHYYGVGAYLRPLEDARRANVRFTTECLAFRERTRSEHDRADGARRPHHRAASRPVETPRAARSRRGWDFDDIRDHYFRLLFDLEPAEVRYTDVERYFAMSRVVSGEVMARTMAEWRRKGSECAGALVWMHRDLWPGAGWGIVDSTGLAKAAYWYLARACAPVALLLTDEGVNGLALHAVNDGPTAIDAELTVTLWNGKTIAAEGVKTLALPSRSASIQSADAIIGRFTDIGYTYRFGPPGHNLVVATLRDRATGNPISESIHFPGGLRTLPSDPSMTAEATQTGPREWVVSLDCESAAVAVAVDINGFVPSDS